MSFKVRNARAADVPAMHRLRLSVRENRLLDPQRITEACYLPYISSGTAWVAETDSRIVGFAAVDGPERRVWALFIDPQSEGLGIGRALHGQMLGWAREAGIVRLFLSTEDGSRAVRFYERAGWQRCGTSWDGEVLFERCVES
jgi:GNAT superfamily N-acetyltransferase